MSSNNLNKILYQLHQELQNHNLEDPDEQFEEEAESGAFHHPEICGGALSGGALSGGCAMCGYNPAQGAGKKRKVNVRVPKNRKQGAGYDIHCVNYGINKNGKRSCTQYAP